MGHLWEVLFVVVHLMVGQQGVLAIGGTWESFVSVPTGRLRAGGLVRADGIAMVMGGGDPITSSMISGFELNGTVWSTLAVPSGLQNTQSPVGLAQLPSGSVYMVGTYCNSSGALPSSYIFTAAAQAWVSGPQLPTCTVGSYLVTLAPTVSYPEPRLMLAGGQSNIAPAGASNRTYILNTNTGEWDRVSDMNTGRAQGGFVALPDGR